MFMKIERTVNATRNIFFGTVLKVYQIIMPFLMRTAMIYLMGVEYLGLNSLFTSVLQVLNLAELGVGSAMVFSMYKPIANDDKETICALMRLYRTYYHVIGLVIAVIGVVLTPMIPNLIKNDVPADINVYVLYLMNLGLTVLSYWLFAYKNSLLQAHQRSDIISKVNLITNTIQYGVQLATLVLLKNYYVYIIVALATQAMTNIITAVVATRMYPNYKPEGNLDKNVIKYINCKIKDLFTSKIGYVIVNSADTIVISAFLGLTTLALYQNYFYLFTSIAGIITIIFNSVSAGIGNSIVVDTQEKVFNDFKKFTFIISWIAGFCCTCFLCLYQPFMELWVGKDLLLDFNIVICLVVYFFIYEINMLMNAYKDAAGMWHEDRFRPLVTALLNLTMNIILVQVIGLYGIILSTVLSMLFVGIPWLIHNLFTVIFDRKYMKWVVRRIIVYAFVSCIVASITYFICSLIHLSVFSTFVVRLVICLIVSNAFLMLLYHRLPEFKQSIKLLDRMTKGKIKVLHKI